MKFNKNDLSVEEINTILTGLLELPAKFSVNLITKIRQQADEQQAAGAQNTINAEGPLVN